VSMADVPAAASVPIRIFLVDDHELIRRGLRAFLDDEADIEVVDEAASARDAIGKVPIVKPDLVVLDIRLPDGNGVEVCRELRARCPQTKVVMLTSFADDNALMDSIMAGASGYILKATKQHELLDALRKVANGQSLIDPAVTASVFRRLRRQAESSDALEALTSQERKILDLIAEGLTNREIAERIHLAERTVKNYVSHILAKLGMKHRTQVALYASKLRDSE
jgi:two-component system, NarL family, response regulator DevR